MTESIALVIIGIIFNVLLEIYRHRWSVLILLTTFHWLNHSNVLLCSEQNYPSMSTFVHGMSTLRHVRLNIWIISS